MIERPLRRTVRASEQIRLLSSAVRQEIVDTLAILGEATVAEIADNLGRPADGLYYHVRALADGDLIEGVAAADDKDRRYRLAGAGNGPIRLAYDLSDTGNGPELAAFSGALLQIASRDFQGALAATDVVTDGPERELWVSRNKGWLSKDDIREVSRLLERLSELTSQAKAPERRRLMSFAFALSPLSPRPKRRRGGGGRSRNQGS